jgi:hypothetical protein
VGSKLRIKEMDQNIILRRTQDTKKLPFFVKNLPDFMQFMRPETHRQRQKIESKKK